MLPGGVDAAACFLVASYHTSILPLRCGNETRSAVRRGLGEPPPKSPGADAGEACEGESSDDGTQSPTILTAETWLERIDFGSPSVRFKIGRARAARGLASSPTATRNL